MKITKYISKIINRISLIGKITHLYRIKKARTIIKKLKTIAETSNYEGKIIVYLRKINPFVFEELILSIIEDSNIRIIRNKRYTGDGGIDGIFKINSKKIIIQCKRYSNYINHTDVSELLRKVEVDKYHKGIFIHTGKTGKKSKDIFYSQDKIIYISGTKLINLILSKESILKYLPK